MAEKSITIWLHLHRNQNNVSIDTIKMYYGLARTDPSFVTFHNSDKCFDFITNISDKVLLIISGEITGELLQLTDERTEVHSVYLLVTESLPTAFICSKLQGTFTVLDSLLNHLRTKISSECRRRHSRRREENDFIINSLQRSSSLPGPTCASTSPSHADHQQQRQEIEFFYAALLRDILLESESSKKDMVKFLQKRFANDRLQQNHIKQFDEYYIPSKAIFWYSQPGFLFRLLNQALREQNTDTLYSLRCFIKDLHLQLGEQHHQQRSQGVDNGETVYRGQQMKTEEFNRRIRDNVNGFFSVTSYLSTTRCKSVASMFAGFENGPAENLVERSILFEIKIDQTINKFIYASISEQSAVEGEEEILFTMGAIFKVISVEYNDADRYWTVKLSLTDEEDEELVVLSDFFRKDIMLTPSWLGKLTNLMYQLGEYEKAERFCLLAMAAVPNRPTGGDYSNYVQICEKLCAIYNAMGMKKKAQNYERKALTIKQRHGDEIGIHHSVARSFIHSVNFSFSQRRFKDTYKYCTDLVEKDIGQHEPDELATAYAYIGLFCRYRKQNYREALVNLNRALEIQQNWLPPNHPEIGILFHRMAEVYREQRKEDLASKYFEKALAIQSLTLPKDHPATMRTCKKRDQVFALQNSSQSLEQTETVLDPSASPVQHDRPGDQAQEKKVQKRKAEKKKAQMKKALKEGQHD